MPYLALIDYQKKFEIPLLFEDKFYKDLMENIFFMYNAENHQLALPDFNFILNRIWNVYT